MKKWPIGVFASVDAGLGVKLEVVEELKIPTIHLHAPHQNTRTPEVAKEFAAKLSEIGTQISVVFGGFEGESYADIPTVTKTVGLVPPETRAERTREMLEIADFARLLGVDVVALHLGFVPHEKSDPMYADIVAVTRQICDHCGSNDQRLHLETGQETADHLLEFIGNVDRDNLFINFDPANMILYGSGEPLEALRKVGAFVRSCHAKDGTWSDQPGVEWGREVPLGQGDVNIEQFVATLNEIGYDGPLTIEREISGEKQIEDIRVGIEYLAQVKARLGIA